MVRKDDKHEKNYNNIYFANIANNRMFYKEILNKTVGEKPIVYTSFYPLYFLANEIGRDNIDLRMVIPIGSRFP